MKKIVVIAFLLFFSLAVVVAQVNIRTYLSRDTIKFAQNTTLNIDVKVSAPSPVLLPQLADTLTKDLEIVDISIDTLRQNKNYIYRFHIEVFAFDDTIFSIPAIPLRVENKVIYSDSTLRLVVLPIEIDSAQISRIDTSKTIDIFNVKKPIYPPMTLKELWLRYRYWLLALLLIALLAYIVYKLIQKFKQRQQLRQIPEEELLPPHQLAIKRLKQLEERRLYQRGDFKEFYFELSEILRQYIERRFYIRALESTTSELKILLEAIADISEDMKIGLSELFDMADLAKFADFKPHLDVCEAHLKFAYNFVEQTMPRQEPEQEADDSVEIGEKII